MAGQQIILLIINVVGGAAVIGSYVFGLAGHSGGANVLWGNISTSVRPLYFVSMILAALGYFAFLYFILFRIVPDQTQIANRFGFNLFYWIFIGILVPSALWMTFTYAWVANPGMGWWVAVRAVLIIVGLASCALVWALLSLQSRQPPLLYWMAVGGSAYFAFHTAVLDMIIWPMLFR